MSAEDTTWHEAFINRLRQTGSVLKACKAVDVRRATAYEHWKRYPDFQKEWEDIIDATIDKLEESAIKRATNGTVTEWTDLHGNQRRDVKHETQLTIFMLQKRRRERYGDNPISADKPDPDPRFD